MTILRDAWSKLASNASKGDHLQLSSSIVVPLLAAIAAVLVIRAWTASRLEAAVPFSWQRPAEADPAWEGKLLEDPHLHAGGPHTITAYDPSSGSLIAEYPSLSSAGVASQIQLATRASESWRRTTFAERRRVLRSLSEWIIKNKDEIAQVCVRDTGKGMLDAALGEILTTLEKLNWMVTNGERYLAAEKRPTSWLLAHKVSHVHFEPLGVVAAVVSWNYPFHNLLSPVMAALMSGNAIVVKTSEAVAWSSSHFARAMQSCLEACGHDPNTVQVLVGCEAEAARALTRSKEISHLTFIGSDKVGKEIARDAAENLLPVTLELGGKDPSILLESADVDFFQDVFLKAVFTGAGQGCIASERFIVHSTIYERFLATMTPRVAQLRPGRDVGAMINGARLSHLEKLVEDAVKQGARLLVGGKQYQHPQRPKGHYFEPTLLADVTMEMEVAKQECFAPIMLVLKADSTEHCIELANSSIYGLGSAVFGRKREDCKYVASKLQCGMVSINDFGVFYLNQSLPFGGRKSSGYGRFGGPEGLRSLCNVKAVTVDQFHGIIQTSIPGPLKYPIVKAERAWKFVCGLIDVMYAPSLGDKLSGVWALLSA